MTAAETTGGTTLAIQMRAVFLELARQEDECAAVEAAAQPYWVACPSSVQEHRAAAAVLRNRADHLATLIGREIA
ncbi:hypothetical protein [Nocardioides sp. AN3]